ncbi:MULTISPECIES: hypothetical protein [unclassified Microcoleus]|uniref:hypothetical protein n=2 Tax=unclassified Microcoleus TaxID=2642155 RepID=UPI002FD7106D
MAGTIKKLLVKYNLMSAGFEVEMVLVGKVLLRVRNLPLATEFLTTATAILARSSAWGTLAIEMNAVSILDSLYTLILL